MKNIRTIIKNNWKIIIFILTLLIFLFIAEDVLEKQLFTFDTSLYHFLVKLRNPILNGFFISITHLGGFIALGSISCLGIIFIKNKSDRILICVNIVVSFIMNVLLKYEFARQRPIEDRLISEIGYSFPSGHAMVSTAVYGLFIYFIYTKLKNYRLKNFFIGLLVLLIILIDISRVYVGVHYASDVLAGTCFSIAYLILILSYKKEFDVKKFFIRRHYN